MTYGKPIEKNNLTIGGFYGIESGFNPIAFLYRGNSYFQLAIVKKDRKRVYNASMPKRKRHNRSNIQRGYYHGKISGFALRGDNQHNGLF